MHHTYDNPEAGTDRIGVSLRNLHPDEGLTKWSFKIRHGYEPSASNNWAVFLMSDADPSLLPDNGSLNGFAIGVNQTGYDDTLRLWKIKGDVFIPVVNSNINWQTGIGITDAVKIETERSTSGLWSVSVSRLNDDPIGISTGKDSELFNPGWLVVSYKYTSTRDRLLWLDDISVEGIFYEDNDPPKVTKCEVTKKNSVLLSFNEEPSPEILLPANFTTSNGNNKSTKINKKSAVSFNIEFENQFFNKVSNTLIISNLCDRSGNCGKNIIVDFTPVLVDPGDVIISEIMARPIPVVSLPGKEYLEIKNRTSFPFNLKNWKLLSESQSFIFPDKNIMANEIMIITSVQDTSFFMKYGKVTGLKTFPSLTDEGKILVISDSSGNLIHGIEYSADWYGDELKAEGGWSLEMIDTQFPFYQEGNWHASVSREGGSPGKTNSVSGINPDNSFYGIVNAFPDDSLSIIVGFSETVIGLTENIKSIKIDGKEIKYLVPSDLIMREYTFVPSEPLLRGQIYVINLTDDIKDFAGNKMQKGSFRFGIPEPALKGDILFNELLFNPLPGDPDYIEFFNCSGKVIDASRLQLVSVNDETGDTSGVIQVSGEKRCILPNEYYAITTDKAKVIERYSSSDAGKVFEVPSLPSMPDDKGHLILYNRELDRIDEVFYNEEMHYSLLQSNEGISLEKIRPQNLSAEKSGWHSASEAPGWGTPGAPNSVFSEQPVSVDLVVLSSTKITPDNDGNEDVLLIDLKFPGNGNVVSVSIYDETGSYVRKLTNNLLAGPEVSVIWDGTSDDGEIVKTGIYIILISAYNDTGKTVRWKKVCTVIRE